MWLLRGITSVETVTDRDSYSIARCLPGMSGLGFCRRCEDGSRRLDSPEKYSLLKDYCPCQRLSTMVTPG